MLKTKILLFGACLIVSLPQANAQKRRLLDRFKIYGGLNMNGTSSKDFDNFHISDWQNYGLLSQDPESEEGRVAVNLSDKKPKSMTTGIHFGIGFAITKKLDVELELQKGFSGVEYTGIFASVNYDFYQKKRFKLGANAKIGMVSAKADFGTISLLPNYTPPVILPEGTFDNGDQLEMQMSGLGVSIGLTPEYKIANHFSIRGLVGYQFSFASDPTLEVNGLSLPMSAKGVVKNDYSATQAGINPTFNVSGINLQLGLVYRFAK